MRRFLARFTVAALLAVALVFGVIGFAAGQVVASLDQDDDHISACVGGGSDLTTGSPNRTWTWLDEDRGSCGSNAVQIDWPNDLGD